MATPTLMQQARVRVAEVDASRRLRPVSEAGVESLMASVTETGVMKDAIHVRKRKDGKLVLIAGAHRLEMAKRLGWDEIEAKVWTDVTDDWARLMEIDDNLAGAEMNALDTAVFLANRKAIYERLHPETKRGGDRRSADFQTDIVSVSSFARATAEKFGLADRHVRRLVAAGTKLHPDQVASLRAAPRPVTLKDLGDLARINSTGERYAVIAALAEGSAKSAAEARRAYSRREAGGEAVPAPQKDPVEAAFKALSIAWRRAPIKAKRRFLDEYAAQIFLARDAGEADQK